MAQTFTPRPGVARERLATDVRTTLGRADTAAQPLQIPLGKFASSAQIDYNGETQAGLDGKVADLLKLGPRPIWLHFHFNFDGSTLKIVQFGFTGTTQSEANVDYLVNKLLAAGFTIAGIKIGNPGSPPGGFSTSFWNAYNALLDQLAAKFQTIAAGAWFCVTNEYILATSDPAQATGLGNAITTVKNRGFKASMSMVGMVELSQNVVRDSLDGYCVNTYPVVGTKGALTPAADVQDALTRTGVLDGFRAVKAQTPTKPCIITEFGTTDKANALEYTAAWTSTGPDNNGAIQTAYWNGALPALGQAVADGVVDQVVGWDGGIFSPYKFASSLAVMKKWIAIA